MAGDSVRRSDSLAFSNQNALDDIIEELAPSPWKPRCLLRLPSFSLQSRDRNHDNLAIEPIVISDENSTPYFGERVEKTPLLQPAKESAVYRLLGQHMPTQTLYRSPITMRRRA